VIGSDGGGFLQSLQGLSGQAESSGGLSFVGALVGGLEDFPHMNLRDKERRPDRTSHLRVYGNGGPGLLGSRSR
jgi:hypothetical protein